MADRSVATTGGVNVSFSGQNFGGVPSQISGELTPRMRKLESQRDAAAVHYGPPASPSEFVCTVIPSSVTTTAVACTTAAAVGKNLIFQGRYFRIRLFAHLAAFALSQ